MALAHFRILIHELFNKYTDIVLEAETIIILDGNSAVYMANNGKDANHTRHISRKVHLLRNVKNYKMYKIDWCEGGLQLEDITTNNVRETDLNLIIKYIVVRLDN